jgi:magnesium transporter
MGKGKDKRRKDEIHRRTLPGAPPGTLAVDPEAMRSRIRVMAYGSGAITDKRIEDPQAVREFLDRWPVTWVNVDGLGEAVTLGKIGEVFDLHRLSLEDVVNVHQRAKVEPYGKYLFIVGRMVNNGSDEALDTEQLSIFLGKNYVLTFQEHPGDCFDTVRDRISKAGGRIRNCGPDYLAYALIDAFIDDYFPVLERYGERLEALEDEVITRADTQIIAQIHQVKRDLLVLRRAIWPLREAVNSLARDPTPLISDETRIYLRDCYDHAVQLIDLLENYREIASSLVEVYLSSVSNRLNEIMKVLTIFTVVFIPLNFIASIYGMNFNPESSPWNMPELNWRYGYPFILALMSAVALSMLILFRKKKWIGSLFPKQERKWSGLPERRSGARELRSGLTESENKNRKHQETRSEDSKGLVPP